MWQKEKGAYHLLIVGYGRVEDVKDGRFLQAACRRQVQMRRSRQKIYPHPNDRKCGICSGVSELIHTSVEEAIRYSLKRESRLPVLKRALDLTRSATLQKAIGAKIRKVESRSQEGRTQ